ncbi:MAG: AEC family transporter [Clostridia bacterium]|nr:AEC family transporter [Clostridia bacterium]
MIESLIYSINVVIPMLLLILVGYMLKRIGLVTEGFMTVADKLVFKLCLPSMLFLDVVEANAKSFDKSFVSFCLIAVVIMAVAASFIAVMVTRDNKKRGAMAQGMYRSNSAILGTMLVRSMFDNSPDANSMMAVTLPFFVVTINILAVVILTVFAPSEKRLTKGEFVKKLVINIAANPLIIAIIAGTAVNIMLSSIKAEPSLVLIKTLEYLSDMAVPLSLISLGATVSFKAMKGRVGIAVLASLMKTFILPWIIVLVAITIGYRGYMLGIIFVLFGGPAAVSSYIMAKNMNSDHILAGQILMITTLLSCLTNFIGVFLLRYFAFI